MDLHWSCIAQRWWVAMVKLWAGIQTVFRAREPIPSPSKQSRQIPREGNCQNCSIISLNLGGSKSMGGYGSTRWNWHNKRLAAEDCRRLPFRMFKRHLQAEQFGQVTWSRNGQVISTIGFQVKGEGQSPLSLWLKYTITRTNGEKRDVDYPIRLTTTPLPWGGIRHWFTCPGAGCGRRVSVLYLATGRDYFLCRHCLRLSYRSRQEGYQERAFYGHLAGLMRDKYPRVTWRTLKEVFRD